MLSFLSFTPRLEAIDTPLGSASVINIGGKVATFMYAVA